MVHPFHNHRTNAQHLHTTTASRHNLCDSNAASLETGKCGCWMCGQAFTLRVRPAVDNVESVVDRSKMTIYKTFARLGLPCPITGTPGSIGKEAIQTEQHS